MFGMTTEIQPGSPKRIKEIGDRLAKVMERLKMSQHQVARAVGLAQPQINAIVNGQRKHINLKHMEQIEQGLNLPAGYLLNGHPEPAWGFPTPGKVEDALARSLESDGARMGLPVGLLEFLATHPEVTYAEAKLLAGHGPMEPDARVKYDSHYWGLILKAIREGQTRKD